MDDYCIFILTFGRPNNIATDRTLRKCGYTGEIFYVVDDADDALSEYRSVYGAKVLTFSKKKIATEFDEGDNFEDRRTVFYARNACFSIAKTIGYRYFIEMDDDYTRFAHRFSGNRTYCNNNICSLDRVFAAVFKYYKSANIATIALSQGGDHIGGGKPIRKISLRRKAMNSFFCCANKPIMFQGKINEDVNTYTERSRAGYLFFTVMQEMIIQVATQENPGGMTDIYLSGGTFVKSFYSVMYTPSAVKIGVMGQTDRRIHHKINWGQCAPKIIREEARK